MRLGWYDNAGSVVVTPEVANDPDRLAEVRDHESAHHLIATTTSFGLVHMALHGAAENIYWSDSADQRYPTVKAMVAVVTGVSKLAHEAVASYASLTILPGDARDRAVERLPDLYREGYELFSQFFSKRDIADTDRALLTQIIGARAFQTKIVHRWFAGDLTVPENLIKHLAHRDNQPNWRLAAILAYLQQCGDDEIPAQVGAYIGESGEAQLPSSIAAGRIGIVPIHDIPDDRFDTLKRIAKSVGGHGELTWEQNPLSLNLVMAPPQISVKYPPDNCVTSDWAKGADLAQIWMNVFPWPVKRVAEAPYTRTLAPNTADVHLLRPDYRSSFAINMPLSEVTPFLSGHPTKCPAICQIEQVIAIAHRSGAPEKSIYNFRHWISDHLLLTSMGISEHIVWIMDLLEGNTRQWLGMGYPISVNWGYALLRPMNDTWPVLLHPTLFSEWSQFLSGPVGNRIVGARSAQDFFGDDQDLARVGLTYMRGHLDWVGRANDWEQRIRAMLKKIFEEPMVDENTLRSTHAKGSPQ